MRNQYGTIKRRFLPVFRQPKPEKLQIMTILQPVFNFLIFLPSIKAPFRLSGLFPGQLVEIPVNGFNNAAGKIFIGLPAQLRCQLGRINRITAVMPRAILYKNDQIFIRTA